MQGFCGKQVIVSFCFLGLLLEPTGFFQQRVAVFGNARRKL
jgi:hypothetical protein